MKDISTYLHGNMYLRTCMEPGSALTQVKGRIVLNGTKLMSDVREATLIWDAKLQKHYKQGVKSSCYVCGIHTSYHQNIESQLQYGYMEDLQPSACHQEVSNS
jgi:hypothetical protein